MFQTERLKTPFGEIDTSAVRTRYAADPTYPL